MAFDSDIFAQARAEVANKGMLDQVGHSRLFHSTRSAFSSGGSFGSKAAGAAIGVGKLFLSLIPVPVVSALVGAVVDAVESGIRGMAHGRKIDDLKSKEKSSTATAKDRADLIKFNIKELTVQNLDRYRWKVANSIEQLNEGLNVYNSSRQGCDDFYAIAMLSEQYMRRKNKLTDELGKFQDVINRVEAWIKELETNQGVQLMRQIELIKKKSKNEVYKACKLMLDRNAYMIVRQQHADCQNWCYILGKQGNEPNLESVKSFLGKVSMVMAPIAVTLIAVRQSDFNNDSSNSKFNVSSSSD